MAFAWSVAPVTSRKWCPRGFRRRQQRNQHPGRSVDDVLAVEGCDIPLRWRRGGREELGYGLPPGDHRKGAQWTPRSVGARRVGMGWAVEKGRGYVVDASGLGRGGRRGSGHGDGEVGGASGCGVPEEHRWRSGLEERRKRSTWRLVPPIMLAGEPSTPTGEAWQAATAQWAHGRRGGAESGPKRTERRQNIPWIGEEMYWVDAGSAEVWFGRVFVRRSKLLNAVSAED